MAKALHIVSFDNPWPPDYGGAIDVFYKLEALKKAGAKIWLHLFTYGRNDTFPLDRFAEKVFVYPRRKCPRMLFSKKPFIVRTRMPETLWKNLQRNDWPVLFEGIHTTGFLPRLDKQRTKLVRIHNVESDYYAYLARHETGLFRRRYFAAESRKLAAYEPERWSKADMNFCLSPAEKDHIEKYGPAMLVPVFHPFREVRIPEAPATEYVLFHGNLSVIENERAALFLWQRVVRPLGLRMVVAGKNPPASLISLAARHPKLGLVANPHSEQMNRLIHGAAVHLIYSENPAGFKLKLLYALARGHKILASRKLLTGTPLADVIPSAEGEEEWRHRLRDLMTQAFDRRREENRRNRLLQDYFNNERNAAKILRYVY